MLALAALVTSVVILAAGRRLYSPTLLLVAFMVAPMLGFEHLVGTSGWPPGSALVFLFPVLFCIGATWFARPMPPFQEGRQDVAHAAGGDVAVWVVGALVIYHFSVVGVPALSLNVETNRFAFDSGLFGIPGRMVLFALPILALVSGTRSSLFSRYARVSVWSMFVISRVAMGFKSGVLEVVIVGLTAFLIRRPRITIRQVIAVSAAALGAVLYATWVGNRYTTVSAGGGFSMQYVIDRLVSQGAEPIWYALSLSGRESSSFLLHDLHYFGEQYFGIPTSVNFASDQVVSSLITGTARAGDSFLVPVTVGGAAYVVASVGAAVGVLVVVVLGAVFQRSCRTLCTADTSSVRAVAASAFLLACRTFTLSGGGVYVIINYGAVAALVVLLVVVGRRVQRPSVELVS